MSAIAQNAGVAMGTIYHHFASKEELVNALYKNLLAQMGTYVLGNYTSEAPVHTRLTQLWTDTLQFIIRHPKEFLFGDQYAYSPYIDPTAKKDDSGWSETMAQALAEGQAQGVIKQMDPEILIHVVMGLISSLAKGHIAGKYTLTDEMVETAVNLCWDAVKR
jgi:TetR/AcrR family transcriptional regulator, repressor of fatR-cypB operon